MAAGMSTDVLKTNLKTLISGRCTVHCGISCPKAPQEAARLLASLRLITVYAAVLLLAPAFWLLYF
jgi:hypothetical protein